MLTWFPWAGREVQNRVLCEVTKGNYKVIVFHPSWNPPAAWVSQQDKIQIKHFEWKWDFWLSFHLSLIFLWSYLGRTRICVGIQCWWTQTNPWLLSGAVLAFLKAVLQHQDHVRLPQCWSTMAVFDYLISQRFVLGVADPKQPEHCCCWLWLCPLSSVAAQQNNLKGWFLKGGSGWCRMKP